MPVSASRRRTLTALVLTMTVLLILPFAVITSCKIFYERSAAPSSRPISLAKALPSDLTFDISIDLSTPYVVYRVYRDQSPSPKRIVLDSKGGDPWGAWISGLVLKYFAVPVAVAENSLCASACVSMMLTAGNYTIDPKGFLLFHAGRRTTVTYDCEFCQAFHDKMPGIPMGETTRRVMSEWAGEISPNLKAFLGACSRNPLDTVEGIALSGAQIDAISKGRNDFSCDDISFQDYYWVEKIRRTPS